MDDSLDHINVWLLEDIDSWTIVDTGFNLPEARAAWEQIFESFLDERPIKQVICTHLHPDHVGLAGWLMERDNANLLMSREEYFMCRDMVSYTGKDAPDVAIAFYRGIGFNDEQLEDYRVRFGSFGSAVYNLPENYTRLEEGELLSINGNYWQVVIGRGHSPEHVCLFCPSLKLLISGDQVLPKITSNISVQAVEPHSDPMRDWLSSCHRIRESLPRDVLVLPAHETPFYGLHERLNQLIVEHESDLNKLHDALVEPMRVVDMFPVLFKRKIDATISLTMASGETLANLNCLLARQRISKFRDQDGIYWYQQKTAEWGR